MLKLSPLSIGLLALTIAAPVFAADLPGTAAHPAPAATTKPAPVAQTTPVPKAGMVDINAATAADLKALPGMTDSDAAKIVQGRPYKDPSDLTAKKILSDAEYAKIKDRLVAGQNKS
jgi:DNA uptake protein ComE-like DNA-binding protein